MSKRSSVIIVFLGVFLLLGTTGLLFSDYLPVSSGNSSRASGQLPKVEVFLNQLKLEPASAKAVEENFFHAFGTSSEWSGDDHSEAKILEFFKTDRRGIPFEMRRIEQRLLVTAGVGPEKRKVLKWASESVAEAFGRGACPAKHFGPLREIAYSKTVVGGEVITGGLKDSLTRRELLLYEQGLKSIGASCGVTSRAAPDYVKLSLEIRSVV